MESVKTTKGTVLPLMNLKGKPYMMVAHRIVWFNEEVASYSIVTEFLELTDSRAVAKAIVTIFDKDGKVVKVAPGTKAEDKSSFADFTEKAETGAIGRAITALGYGTAYALADLEEGTRLIDAPVLTTPKVSATAPSPVALGAEPVTPPSDAAKSAPGTAPRPSSFRNRKKSPAEAAPATNGLAATAVPVANGAAQGDGW